MTISDEELAAIKAQAVEEFLAEAEREGVFEEVVRDRIQEHINRRNEAAQRSYALRMQDPEYARQYNERKNAERKKRYDEDQAYRERILAENSERARGRYAKDSEFRKKKKEDHARRMRAIRENDPDRWQAIRDRENAARRDRLASNPELLEAKRAYQREAYRRKKAEGERDERQTDND